MASLEILLEAEKRGILPEDKKALLDEARKRGIVAGNEGDFATRASRLDATDLSIERAKDGAFGDYLRAQAAKPQPGETQDAMFKRQYGGISSPDVGVGEGMARGYVQGGTFGAGDEIVAGGAAALNKMTGKDPGKSLPELYNAYLGRERDSADAFSKSNPALSLGSEIVGSIPTAVATGGTGTAQTLGGRVLAGGANAAAQGGVYGFNSGEGGFQNRAVNAGKTAAVAAPIGAAAPVVAQGTKAIANRLLEGGIFGHGGAAKKAGMSLPAYRAMSQSMQADDFAQGARNIRAAGPDAMLADSGASTQRMLDTAIQKSGTGARIAREAVDGRAEAAGRKITSSLDDALGVPGGVKTTETAIRKGSSAARDSTYKAAYSKAIDYSTDLGRKIESIVSRRVPNSAIKAANELIRVSGDDIPQILVNVADDGTMTFKKMPNVAQIDYITRGLNRVAEKADSQGKLGSTTDMGRAYSMLSRELRGLTKQAVPEYATALETAAEPISARNALRMGEKMLSARMAREEVADALVGMTKAEKGFMAQGVRSQIDEALANVKRAMTDANVDAREAVKVVKDLSSRASREKVTMLLGEKEAGKLFSELDRATKALDLRASVSGNSATFARQQMDATVKAANEPGVIGKLLEGSPVQAGKKLIQNVTGRTPAAAMAKEDRLYGEIAKILTEQRGSEALRLLNHIRKVPNQTAAQREQVRKVTELLLRRNAAVTAPAMN
jgi:hypothetical protein